MALSILWDNTFRNCSHGFRHNRGIHTTVEIIRKHFVGVTWVIEGDISNCFGSIPYSIIFSCLKKKIGCEKSLALINKLLTSGYIDGNGVRLKNKIGIPQGSIPGPILANIVLHELDIWITEKYFLNPATSTLPRQVFWEHYNKAKALIKGGRKDQGLKYWDS